MNPHGVSGLCNVSRPRAIRRPHTTWTLATTLHAYIPYTHTSPGLGDDSLVRPEDDERVVTSSGDLDVIQQPSNATVHVCYSRRVDALRLLQMREVLVRGAAWLEILVRLVHRKPDERGLVGLEERGRFVIDVSPAKMRQRAGPASIIVKAVVVSARQP